MADPSAPDMVECTARCRCKYGPYADKAYDCNSPCPSDNFTFDCVSGCMPKRGWKDGQSNCVLFQTTRDIVDSSSPVEGYGPLYINVPGPGDYFGQNDVENSWDIGVSGRVSSDSGTAFSWQPAEYECAPGECPPGSYDTTYYSQPPQLSACYSGTQQGGTQGMFPFIWAIFEPGTEYSEARRYEIGPSVSVRQEGSAHCNTETASYEVGDFPSWGTCTNPFRLAYRSVFKTRVAGTAGSPGNPCGECIEYERWGVTGTFLEHGDIDVTFTESTGCGFLSGQQVRFNYSLTKRFENSGNQGTQGQFRQGTINEEVYTDGATIATPQSGGYECMSVDVYLIPAQNCPVDTSGNFPVGSRSLCSEASLLETFETPWSVPVCSSEDPDEGGNGCCNQITGFSRVRNGVREAVGGEDGASGGLIGVTVTSGVSLEPQFDSNGEVSGYTASYSYTYYNSVEDCEQGANQQSTTKTFPGGPSLATDSWDYYVMNYNSFSTCPCAGPTPETGFNSATGYCP